MVTAPVSIRQRVPVPISLQNGRSVTADFVTFFNLPDGREHIALVFGEIKNSPLVRVHSECLTGDVFASQKCDCGPQLIEAIETMAQKGGIILYLRQEGRDIGLYNKLDAYAVQAQRGLDTFAANKAIGHAIDKRDYQSAALMLEALGAAIISLLTNNPDKKEQLERYGILVESMVPTALYQCAHNENYLTAKRKAGHKLVG